MEEEDHPPKKNIFNDLNNAVLDLTEKVFGKDGKEFLVNMQEDIKEFNVKTIQAWVKFTDEILEETKLGENPVVVKSNDAVKDLLRQAGVLKEDREEDF